MVNKKELHRNKLFQILGINSREDLIAVSRKSNVSVSELKFYNDNRIFPAGESLGSILTFLNVTEFELKLRLGILDNYVINWIAAHPELIIKNIEKRQFQVPGEVGRFFRTDLGSVYEADCLALMQEIESESVDLIFADPPFNLGKIYESGINDQLSEEAYLEWTEKWLHECVRILAPGGALFVYNLPYWQTYTANILNRYLNFRHWVAIYMRGLMPVAGRMHPSHYALLYYVKGDRPRVFNQQRIPMSTCRHCGGEVHDYGGKKKTLNPKGLSIADVWTDIHPVRHKKFKNRDSNELPVKLLHRIISLATNEGDFVFDPFGGSGTTYAVAENLRRRWLGCEIGSIDPIISRLNNNEDANKIKRIEEEVNVLFTKEQINLRRKNNYWTQDILK